MKKGFTLIELLGVIVLLGIIGLIVVPIVQGTIKDSSEKICEYQEKISKKAAKNYIASNPYQVPESITLQQLIDAGYLEESKIKCGSVEDTIKINPNYVNGDNTKIKGYSYEYIKNTSGEEDSQTNNTVYAINTNIITINSSTIQDAGSIYSSCAQTGKNACLRYTVATDKIVGAEVCFIKDGAEYCLKGGDNGASYLNNMETLKTAFGLNDCSAKTDDYGNHYYCSIAESFVARAYENGYVVININNESWHCGVNDDKTSLCLMD